MQNIEARVSRELKVKAVAFFCITLFWISIAVMAIQPVWLCGFVSFLLVLVAILGYSTAAAGSGHVADGLVVYCISAALLICLVAGVGYSVFGEDANQSLVPNSIENASNGN